METIQAKEKAEGARETREMNICHQIETEKRDGSDQDARWMQNAQDEMKENSRVRD